MNKGRSPVDRSFLEGYTCKQAFKTTSTIDMATAGAGVGALAGILGNRLFRKKNRTWGSYLKPTLTGAVVGGTSGAAVSVYEKLKKALSEHDPNEVFMPGEERGDMAREIHNAVRSEDVDALDAITATLPKDNIQKHLKKQYGGLYDKVRDAAEKAQKKNPDQLHTMDVSEKSMSKDVPILRVPDEFRHKIDGGGAYGVTYSYKVGDNPAKNIVVASDHHPSTTLEELRHAAQPHSNRIGNYKDLKDAFVENLVKDQRSGMASPISGNAGYYLQNPAERQVKAASIKQYIINKLKRIPKTDTEWYKEVDKALKGPDDKGEIIDMGLRQIINKQDPKTRARIIQRMIEHDFPYVVDNPRDRLNAV